MPLFRDRLHGVLQYAVDAVLDGNFGVAGFDVDVTGAAFEGSEDDCFDQPNNRADGGVARQTVAGDGLFALFLLLGNLESEGLGRLLEDALGLLGALEDVTDLSCGGYLDGQLFSRSEERRVGKE